MSRRSSETKPRNPADSAAASGIAVYLMSDYTQGIRQAGNFHLIKFEDGQTDRINRFVPHRHDFFEIIWLRSGRGHVRSDLRSYPVGPNTLVFTSPGQVHSWELQGAARGEIASFTAEFFSVNSDHPGMLAKMPFLYSGSVDPILRLEPAESRRINEVFLKLHEQAAEPEPGREDLVRAYLTILLTLARQFFARRPASSTTPAPVADLLSRRFRLALEEHFPRLLEVAEFAEHLGVSRTHLNEHLQRELGRSASEIIHERIVLEAKRLLAHTTMPAAQIAYRLRFQDPSYFGRFFRRTTGQTPGAFRDQARASSLAS
jgi:AraC-like DNA-binding protein/mannose-6-phosphate isomerase-like protein (cupin superfamily)